MGCIVHVHVGSSCVGIILRDRLLVKLQLSILHHVCELIHVPIRTFITHLSLVTTFIKSIHGLT